MSEHEPSVHAMRAAEVIENEYDLSNGAAEYQVPYVAEIIERETGVGEAVKLIERLLEAWRIGECDFAIKDDYQLDEKARDFLARFNK